MRIETENGEEVGTMAGKRVDQRVSFSEMIRKDEGIVSSLREVSMDPHEGV